MISFVAIGILLELGVARLSGVVVKFYMNDFVAIYRLH